VVQIFVLILFDLNLINFRKGKKIMGKKKKYIPIDHKKNETKSAMAIIAIVRGNPLMLIFCIQFYN